MSPPHYSACPIVACEAMHLFHRTTILEATRLIPFTTIVLRIREAETEIQLRHRGTTITVVSAFHDQYGYLTGLQSAYNDLPAIRQRYEIRPGDTLAVTIEATIQDHPVLPRMTKEARDYNTQFDRRQYSTPPSRYGGEGEAWLTSDKPDAQGRCPQLEAGLVARVRVYDSLSPPTPEKWNELLASLRAEAQALSDASGFRPEMLTGVIKDDKP